MKGASVLRALIAPAGAGGAACGVTRGVGAGVRDCGGGLGRAAESRPRHRARRTAVASLALAGALTAAAASPVVAQDEVIRRVAAEVEARQHEIVRELIAFLTIPNVASDAENIRRNAEALKSMMERRGIRTRLLETSGPPMVYGELPAAGATTTLLFYAHYDGQPVDPSKWVGQDPFRPILRTGRLEAGGEVIAFPERRAYDPEWRIYGRSASDDKMPIVALLAALDALQAVGSRPTVNLKFLFEGDEEASSPNLERVLRDHARLLRSDLVLMVDGPEHPSLRPTLVFGARGITTARVTVYGPTRPLHSGHYGNWAPNPAQRLASLVASMKDESGRVLIEGWYDDVVPLSDEERAAIAAIPGERPESFGFAEPEGGAGAARLERIALPSLNVRGLASGWVGEDARTLVPDSAVAEFDLRLVPNVDPDRQVDRLIEHIRRQGYHVVTESPDSATRARYPKIARVERGDGGYPATRTPFSHPVARRVVEAVSAASAEPPVLMPMMGGSVPAVWFPKVLGTNVLLLPLVNPDNNQHAENENLRIGNLFEGIATVAAVMRLAPSAATTDR